MAKRHLIGIGGVGMSALATALVKLGDEVTGADRTLGTPNIKFLESLGVRVFPDDGSYTSADLYAEYRKAKADMQEVTTIKANIDYLLGVTDGHKNKEQER